MSPHIIIILLHLAYLLPTMRNYSIICLTICTHNCTHSFYAAHRIRMEVLLRIAQCCLVKRPRMERNIVIVYNAHDGRTVPQYCKLRFNSSLLAVYKYWCRSHGAGSYTKATALKGSCSWRQIVYNVFVLSFDRLHLSTEHIINICTYEQNWIRLCVLLNFCADTVLLNENLVFATNFVHTVYNCIFLASIASIAGWSVFLCVEHKFHLILRKR